MQAGNKKKYRNRLLHKPSIGFGVRGQPFSDNPLENGRVESAQEESMDYYITKNQKYGNRTRRIYAVLGILNS